MNLWQSTYKLASGFVGKICN